jgi:hypothetical protein
VAAVVVGLGVTTMAVPASAADPCTPGGNPVVCENSKPGSDPSEWDIRGAGSSELQGFATDISVNAGNSIGFKIDTPSSAYTIDIYRTGWYQGRGARYITSISPSVPLPQHQPECPWDITTELTDCGRWAVSATWDVPADAVSGVYIALLGDAANDWWSQITFIVRNDDSHADIVFQTSDPTWQAYNTYGGSDFYQGAAHGRAYKISYNRPVTTRGDNDGRDFYFSAEYPMVRFLERNGYDVTYQAGVDTDRYGGLLLNHKTFLSVGHDEYWSAAQRANVEAARDAGVNLAFFSGNEVYWHTRYEPAAAGDPVDYRTLVSYKETWSNAKIDPADEWTGTWRDPRLASQAQGAGLPENALTGTIFMSNVTDLPVTVSSDEGKLRFWRNTGLDALPAGATQALAPHTVGYESDEAPDNGFSPPGLITMSTVSAVVPAYLLDFGNVTGQGTTTHHVTLYRAASGALVFSAGSIQWSWGLDDTHDGGDEPADPRMQQATVNLLADMGVQPATLMTELVAASQSTDVTGPTVTVASPAPDASVPNGTAVTLTGTASDADGRVAAVEVSTDGGATWRPATGTSSWSYGYVQSGIGATAVQVRAVDDSANIGATASRTVEVSCPCSIYGSTVPETADAGDPSPVELGLHFTPDRDGFVTGIRFYKAPANEGTHVGTLWNANGQALAQVTFAGETASGWQTAMLSTAVPVVANTTYVVSYTAPTGRYAAENGAFWYTGRTAEPFTVAGGFRAEPAGVYGAPGQFPESSWEATQYYVDVLFATADEAPLAISGRSPASGATSVPLDTEVSAQFSKPVTAGSAALTLTTDDGTAVAGATAYDAATRTVTFTPSAALAPDTRYTASASALADGGGIAGPASWSFRTAVSDQDPGGRTVSLYDDSDVPEILEAADWVPVTLGVRFASSEDGYVTGVRFYKGPGNTGTHVGALWAVGGSEPLAQATFADETATGWQTVTFAHPVRIAKDTQYIASYSTTVGHYSATLSAFSGVGLQRDPLSTGTDAGAFTYAGGYPGSSSSTSYLVDVVFTRDAAPLAVVGRTPAPGQLGVGTGGTASVTFSAPLAGGAHLELAAGSGTVAGTSSLSSDGTTLTFTPAAPLAASTQYTATATGLVSVDGAQAADVTWSFTTADPDTGGGSCPCTLFGSTTPDVAAANDGAAVELGVAFRPTAAGLVTGVRFYQGAGNDGPHTGTLWSSDGTALRTVTFSPSEAATGWQTATFDTPYEVTPGATYVVSYFAPRGHYAVAANAFTADVTAGPLTAPAAGNGRYRYGGGFPADTWQQSNYFVDVVFVTAAPSLPTVVGVTPAGGATGVAVGGALTATLSKAPESGDPELTVAASGAPVPGASSYDPSTRTVTFTPDATLPYATEVTATVAIGGQPLDGGVWTFTTAPLTLWSDADVPTVAAWDDWAAVQVGTRFTTSAPGVVTAVRFYKGEANSAAHTVKLWSPDGQLLAEAPSTSESASGWQTVTLPEPIALVPGQVYTAAYQTAGGRYSVTAGGLASARTAGPLSTAGGAYVYGDGSAFPNGASSAWYGVDLVFVPSS